ncbi:SdiA-regulated/phytase-like domain-containing protein [Speluncibacter jeojiensis]|uniref:hypothetical protein n=1 Tax=Speluncibacter jeojiensis TaxID=2710754 RepID=UPI00240EBAB7|nr:hypothetical protein [Rhodococcus sp. D2-41]
MSDKRFEVLCTPDLRGADPGDRPGLIELSGLTWRDGTLFAVGDSGSDDRVLALDGECRVRRGLPVTAAHVDVEDLASGQDGTLWLADTGDNGRRRASVALLGMGPDDRSRMLIRRLAYPDGPHDAEALLVGRDGRPVVVTKELLGDSGVYVPADGAASNAPAPSADTGHGVADTRAPRQLVRVATVRLGPTDTPGGPLPLANSVLVTGGAVSRDGTVCALRTYTDVYLYSAPDGDLVRALDRPVLRVPLPDQPQGEAMTFNDAGDLIAGSEADYAVGSEAGDGPLPALPSLVVLRGAVGLVGAARPTGARVGRSPTEHSRPDEGAVGGAIAVAVGGAALAVAVAVAVGVAACVRRRR